MYPPRSGPNPTLFFAMSNIPPTPPGPESRGAVGTTSFAGRGDEILEATGEARFEVTGDATFDARGDACFDWTGEDTLE